MEYTPWLSKLLFYWVNPLMQKGVDFKIKHPDDLYDLPDSLSSSTLSRKFDKILKKNRKLTEADEESYSSTRQEVISRQDSKNQYSLLKALHKCFWVNFYGIGCLKFIADCLGFAGPILLNKLVGFIENKSEDVRLGYAYAFGLFITTLIGKFLFIFIKEILSLFYFRCILQLAL